MTPGTIPWVVRALRDWVIAVRQGMALVTYTSAEARRLALDELSGELNSSGRTTEILWCDESNPVDFVNRIISSKADVLYLLDPDRLLFGDDEKASMFWVNFQRETLTSHPGAQIWWMSPKSAIRFGQQLPDLARFFLFREELVEEVAAPNREIEKLANIPEERERGSVERARELVDRALRASGREGVDRTRIWLELAIPALREFRSAGEITEAATALDRFTKALGPPAEAISPKLNSRVSAKVERSLSILSLSGSEDAGNVAKDSYRLARQVAWSLNTLAILLSDLGRKEEALEPYEEAVRICRQLEKVRPDAFLPGLASSLSNLANGLSDLGRREEALERAEEAARIYRQLEQGRPDAFLPKLAGSLNNLANRLGDLGRREEALERVEEAARIYRQLEQGRPDAFLPELASSLNNLANTLSNLGRGEEALERAEEAAGINQRLARAKPDAFLPDLAMSLNTLAGMLSGLGRREEALERAEEAVDIHRQLGEARPEAFLPNLATSLNNLANVLRNLGRREEALERVEETVCIYRRLVKVRPSAFLPNLAASLNNLAATLSDLGRREEALEQAEEAVGLYRQLAQARPEAFLHNLAKSLSNLAAMLSDLGQREQALERTEEAVGLYRQLAQARPDAFLEDLARALAVRGVVTMTSDPSSAISSFEEAIRILTPAFARLPRAHGPLMKAACQNYVKALEAAGAEPDTALLDPVLSILQKLKPQP